MNKYKIIVLCGESGVGKSYIANQILNEYSDIFHKVITATTRPMREGEINGKDYFFLTEKEFDNTFMLEYCSFNGWSYGTPETSLSKEKINLLVMNPYGIISLSNEPEKYDIKIIRLKIADKERMLRQLDREENPNINEIVRRWQTDVEDFEYFDNLYKDKMFIAEKYEDLSLILFQYAYCWDNSCRFEPIGGVREGSGN